MNQTDEWYVVKQPEGHCIILPAGQLPSDQQSDQEKTEQWGPFGSEAEAIARRVGLIRSGKCQPL